MNEDTAKLLYNSLHPDYAPKEGSVLRQLADSAKAPGIMIRNYKEMREAGRQMKKFGIVPDNIDNYYHKKAQYEVAQLGDIPARIGLALGVLKEIYDVPKNLLNGWSWGDVKDDWKKDLKNNENGSIMGNNNQIPAAENQDLSQDKSPALLLLERALKRKK
jgi:hypothetical protein